MAISLRRTESPRQSRLVRCDQSARGLRPASVAALQGDGSPVVYAPGRQPIWASNTASGDPANVNYPYVQGDGNIVAYKWPRAVW
jgi:hypothetical protein